MSIRTFAASFILAAFTGVCLAQDGQTTAHVSAAYFGGDENAAYYGVRVNHQFNPNYSVSLRYSGSPISVQDFGAFSLRRGGQDWEGMVYYTLPTETMWKLGVGAALPDTPDRGRSLVGTFDLSARTSLKPNFEGAATLKGIVATDSLIFAELEGGYRPTPETYAFVRFGTPVNGNNTRSTLTGDGIRQGVGSLGLRYTQHAGMSLELALTNQLGETTGFSMTPALGGAIGISAQVGIKF